MEKKKYQVRIRKDVTNSFEEDLSKLGIGTAVEIQTLYGKFQNITELMEKISEVPSIAEYEIISIVLVDTDNSDQLGEDFDWDEVA